MQWMTRRLSTRLRIMEMPRIRWTRRMWKRTIRRLQKKSPEESFQMVVQDETEDNSTLNTGAATVESEDFEHVIEETVDEAQKAQVAQDIDDENANSDQAST